VKESQIGNLYLSENFYLKKLMELVLIERTGKEIVPSMIAES